MPPLHLGLRRFSYEDLRPVAARFLCEHNPAGTIPVNIELIAEARLGLEIVPMPGLRDVLAEQVEQPEAFCTSDLSTIMVDRHVYERVPRRARFSIAHEISHVILHREAFGKLQVDGIDDWLEMVGNIDPVDYHLLETQANNLAGLLLVPHGRLVLEVRNIARTVVERGHMQVGQTLPARFLSDTLADVFDVSRGTIVYRVKADNVYHLPGFKIPSDL